MNHLDSLNLHLSNERIRFSAAKTAKERELRAVWISQLEKEIAGELNRLGKEPLSSGTEEMSIDDIAAELS